MLISRILGGSVWWREGKGREGEKGYSPELWKSSFGIYLLGFIVWNLSLRIFLYIISFPLQIEINALLLIRIFVKKGNEKVGELDWIALD
jgi:hypothetical protein